MTEAGDWADRMPCLSWDGIMVLPKTKEDQATEIFNQLTNLNVGDVEEAVRLLFRLRTLDTGYPNPMTKVSRADAALIAGYRQEALECLREVSHLDLRDDLSLLRRLQLLHFLVGNIADAVSLAKRLLDIPGTVNESMVTNLVVTGLLAGDLSLLKSIEDREHQTGHSIAGGTLQFLKKNGIDKILSEHQRIIRDIVQNYQVSAWSRVDFNEDPCITNTIYFDGALTDRKKLERQIENALDAHYREKGVPHKEWRGKIITIVTEAPRHAGVDLTTDRAA